MRLALSAAMAWGLPLASLGADQAPPRERIDFSGGAKDLVLPQSGLENLTFDQRFIMVDRGDSTGGVLDSPGFQASPPQQGFQTNPRLLEMLGRKLDAEKNWIYAKPEDPSSTRAIEEAFKIWHYRTDDLEAIDSKPRGSGALASFFEDKSEAPARPQARTSSSFSSDGPQASLSFDPKPNQDFGIEAGISVKLPGQPGGLRTGRSGADTPDRFAAEVAQHQRAQGSAVNASAAGMPTRVSELLRVPKTIRELVGEPSEMSLLAGGMDPINLQQDGTRQEMNPIMPRRPEDFRSKTPMDPLDAFGAMRPSSSSALSPLREMTVKILGPSSLSPAVAAPADAPKLFQPKTSAIEIPARKF